MNTNMKELIANEVKHIIGCEEVSVKEEIEASGSWADYMEWDLTLAQLSKLAERFQTRNVTVKFRRGEVAEREAGSCTVVIKDWSFTQEIKA